LSLKRLDGSVRMDVTDTAYALPQVAGWFGSSLPSNLHFSGPAVLDANLSGTLERPQIAVTVAADDLHLNGMKGIQLNASAGVSTEQIEVQRFTVQRETEFVTGSGRIGLMQPEPTVDAQFAVANASIHRVLD